MTKSYFLKPLFDYFLKIESNDFFLNFKSYSPWDSSTLDMYSGEKKNSTTSIHFLLGKIKLFSVFVFFNTQFFCTL